MKEENLLSNSEIEEIVNYALNPKNWGHKYNKKDKKEATTEGVRNLLRTMVKDLKGIRENYLAHLEEQKKYYEFLN